MSSLDLFQSRFKSGYGSETALAALLGDLHREMDRWSATIDSPGPLTIKLLYSTGWLIGICFVQSPLKWGRCLFISVGKMEMSWTMGSETMNQQTRSLRSEMKGGPLCLACCAFMWIACMQNTVTDSYQHTSFWPCPNGSHQNSHRYTLPGLLHSVHFHIHSECHILQLATPQSCSRNLGRENVAKEGIQELLELHFQQPSELLISPYRV